MDKYIVSARKYRPTTFSSVIGQQALTTTLKNAIASGKLAHAYLFCGPRGVGKTTCARIFAKTINCLNPKSNGDACDECESCKAFNEGRSFNIHELDAASNNGIENIRQLTSEVMVPPQVGRYKVFIIDEVHMLSQAAFNAFLKTLEEPPSYVIFILATTEKYKILPTILSRCQTYDFNRMEMGDIVAHLENVAKQEGIPYEKEALSVIAHKADGGMRDAMSIFDQAVSFSGGNLTYKKVVENLNVLDADYYFTMTDNALKCNIPASLVLLNDVLSKGFNAQNFINGWASHMRDLLMCRDQQTVPLLEVSDAMRERYREQAARCSEKFLYRALRLCNRCDLNYKASNNRRLLVELTIIEVAQAADGDDGDACGLGPTKHLKPIFQTMQASAAPAPQAASQSAPAQVGAAQTVQSPTPAAPAPTAAAPQEATAPTPIASLLQQKKAAPKTISTISIHGPKTKAAQPAAAAPTAAPTPTVEQNEPVTAEQLSYQWMRFANMLPAEESAMAARMKAITPVLGDDLTVSVAVENQQVLAGFRNLEGNLLQHLRTQLRNTHLQLQFHIVEYTEEAPRSFTRKEQFADMLKGNAALRLLQEALKLELD